MDMVIIVTQRAVISIIKVRLFKLDYQFQNDLVDTHR